MVMREGGPRTMGDALDAFLATVEIERARATYTTYRRLLAPLRSQPWPLTTAMCREFVAERIRSGKARATVSTTAGALRSFANFCRDEGWIVAIHIAVPQPDRSRPHRYLTDAEVARIVALAEDLTLAVHLLRTGLRAAELLSLTVDDIADGLILIRGKGSRWRYVPLPPEAEPLLPASGRLVPISYDTLRRRIRTLGKRAGIPGVHPHLFRHTFATRAVQELDIPTVQTVMGHSSPAMTQRYAASVYQRAAAKKAAGLF